MSSHTHTDSNVSNFPRNETQYLLCIKNNVTKNRLNSNQPKMPQSPKVSQYYVYMIQTIGKLPVHSQCPLYQ